MRRLAALAVSLTLTATACTSTSGTSPGDPSSPVVPSGGEDGDRASARSDTVEDSVYPRYGDPGVDALAYRLDLRWSPQSRRLVAREVLRFRATADASSVRLALGAPLRVDSARIDAAEVRTAHRGHDLVLRHEVHEDRVYRLVLAYAGRPRPVPAPTQRGDIDGLGWTTTRDGETWTMQEPYGAFTWYAVNDQPADKARYRFTITAPDPMVGVANGELVSRTSHGGLTTTRWRLDAPASSYLVTVAIGDLRMTRDASASGVPITYWTPADRPRLVHRLRRAAGAVDWLEERLGPYPFDTLGIVVVDSQSGMETQTMITLGDTAYATSPAVLVHEIAHHWYGDLVTPSDWRDVWMNEGMAMYLQAVWESHGDAADLQARLAPWAAEDQDWRRADGPPADYYRDAFGAINVYAIPALMWDQLRQRVGERTFWRLVRAWPAAHAYGNADYDDITTWWSEQTGEDLTAFFDAWLRGDTTPERE